MTTPDPEMQDWADGATDSRKGKVKLCFTVSVWRSQRFVKDESDGGK